MDSFDYIKYLKEGRIHEDGSKLITEAEEVSEKKYKQGYDDREDESLGARRGAEKGKKQSFKDRRDDSYGKFGKRDAEAKGKAKGPGKNKVNKEGVDLNLENDLNENLNPAEQQKVMSALSNYVERFKPNFGKVEEIADMLSELTGISSNKIQSYLMQLTGGDDEMIFEVGKGYFKKKFGIGKKGFSMDKRKKLKETIIEIKAKMDEGSYPFDQCVADQEGQYGKEGAKRVCGSIRAAYGEGQVNEDKRTDAEEEGYEDGFKDAKKDMKDALSKMKVSELKAKIKEDIIEILSEQDEEVDVDVEDEVKADVDVDVEDDVAVDAQGDDINIKKKSVKADIEVGLSPVEDLVQDSLEAVMKASEQLGNQTLTDQIGNTITYFTREFVVGRNTD